MELQSKVRVVSFYLLLQCYCEGTSIIDVQPFLAFFKIWRSILLTYLTSQWSFSNSLSKLNLNINYFILWTSMFLQTAFGQPLREQLLLILSLISTRLSSYTVLLQARVWAWYDVSCDAIDGEPALDFIPKCLLRTFNLDALAQILTLLII